MDTSYVYEDKYYSHSNKYKYGIFDEYIHMYSDEPYNTSIIGKTRQILSRTRNFKFVDVRYDVLDDSLLVTNISLFPFPKYSISAETGLNVSDGSLPGPIITSSLISRNAFKGLEKCELQRLNLFGMAAGR